MAFEAEAGQLKRITRGLTSEAAWTDPVQPPHAPEGSRSISISDQLRTVCIPLTANPGEDRLALVDALEELVVSMEPTGIGGPERFEILNVVSGILGESYLAGVRAQRAAMNRLGSVGPPAPARLFDLAQVVDYMWVATAAAAGSYASLGLGPLAGLEQRLIKCQVGINDWLPNLPYLTDEVAGMLQEWGPDLAWLGPVGGARLERVAKHFAGLAATQATAPPQERSYVAKALLTFDGMLGRALAVPLPDGAAWARNVVLGPALATATRAINSLGSPEGMTGL